jgi:hypothetical protein
MKIRSFISVFFLALLMVSSRDFADWAKLPKAIEHYVQHSSEEGMSFAAFFKIHYLDDVLIDEDYAQDMELPFKSDSGSLQSVFSSCLVPTSHTTSLLESDEMSAASKTTYFPPSTPDSYLGTIWQPPKQV